MGQFRLSKTHQHFAKFIPFIHRLLKYAYPAIAKEYAIQGRLPLSLLNDPTTSCNKS